MISQVEIAIYNEENPSSTNIPNHTAQEFYSVLRLTMMMIPGNVIGFFFSGAAVTLGVLSILLFSSAKGRTKQRYFLNTYTTLLLLLLVLAEILMFLDIIYHATSLSWSPGKEEGFGARFSRVTFMVAVLTIGLTDGLLVWRCFLVQQVLGRDSSKWCNAFWVFPAFVLVAETAIGLIAVAKYPSGTELKLFTVAFAANIVLNIHATTFIITRLLLHRRAVIAIVRDRKLAAQHIYIVGILLESAVVNLPVAITIAVMIGLGNLINRVILPIVVPSQALAATLIIYQTALGRAVNREKEKEISRLVEGGEHTNPGNVDQLSGDSQP